jgi:hypothetical protein
LVVFGYGWLCQNHRTTEWFQKILDDLQNILVAITHNDRSGKCTCTHEMALGIGFITTYTRRKEE